MSDDLLLLGVFAVPFGIAAVASFITPNRLRWVAGIGVVLAAGLLSWILVAPANVADGEWDTGATLVFGLASAGAGLLLWMVGVACGWAVAHAVRRTRGTATHY